MRAACPGGAGVVLLALVAAGCGEGPRRGAADVDEVPEEERYGGTAVVGSRVGPTTLNPLVSADLVANQIQTHVLWATLLRYDSEQVVRPWLAESWETSPDTREIVFHLREGLAWHDGEPLTAEDVAFTFRRVTDPAVPFPNRSWFDGWEEVTVVGPRTVRFRLTPRAGYLYGWTQTPVLPEHVLGGIPPEELQAHPFGSSEPVGSGPFRFAGRRPDRWIFEANADFLEELDGRPYLDRLVYREIPDETTLLAELLAGEVHFYMDVPASQVARARRDPGLVVATYPSRSYEFIAWNTRRPQFADARVRRALTLAIDREAILEAARHGLGTVTAGPVGPWHWAYDPDREPPPHDPDSARALLERAGWRDADGDGVRENDGRPLAFELATTENRTRQDIAVIVQAALGRVGVAARPRVREAASLAEAITGPARDFDAVILGFSQDWELDDRDLWACDRRDRPFQFTGYCDPELDAVLDSIPLPLGRDVRRRLYRRYDELVAAGQPFTFLYFETVAAAHRRELRRVRVDARGELAGVRDWWLAPGVPAASDR